MILHTSKVGGIFWAAMFVASCGMATAPSDPIPDHDGIEIESQVLTETRVVNVWVPPAYAETEDRFPVVYMPDGGLQEDFPHIANTLADLIARGEFAPVILVGIENTERRRDLSPASSTPYDLEYGPASDGATAFRAFIRDELIPQIEADYRTSATRTIVGESLAGLFVIDTLFRAPQMFDHYVAMDPSLWWGGGKLVQEAPARLAELDLEGRSLWFAGSSAKDIQVNTRSLDAALRSSTPAGLRWTYQDSPGEEHWTIFRATKEAALLWTLGSSRDDPTPR